jgi:hypothetical protein
MMDGLKDGGKPDHRLFVRVAQDGARKRFAGTWSRPMPQGRQLRLGSPDTAIGD